MKYLFIALFIYVLAYSLFYSIGKIFIEPKYEIINYDSSELSKVDVGRLIVSKYENEKERIVKRMVYEKVDHPNIRIFDNWFGDDFIIVFSGIFRINDGYRFLFLPSYRTFHVFERKKLNLVAEYTLFSHRVGDVMFKDGLIYHQIKNSELNKTDKDKVLLIKLSSLTKKQISQ